MKFGAIAAIVIALVLIGGGVFWWMQQDTAAPGNTNPPGATSTPPVATSTPAVTVLIDNLEIPWDIAFLPDGNFLVTERPGDLLKISADGKTRKEIPIAGVKRGGEGGLLGVVLHPDFKDNHYLYLYLGVSDGSGTTNRVERYRFTDDALSEKKVILSGIPGALYHDGGRMEFGPTAACGAQAPAGKPGCYLFVTTGDATKREIAQDLNSLAGKILRIKDDGSIPDDNPFFRGDHELSREAGYIYSYGHRNPQGLAWDDAGRLWETEHGPTGENQECCRDEVNVIEKGGNYGWPVITGTQTKNGMIPPALQSGGSKVWAPASALYYKGSLFFGGLRGAALYEAVLDGNKVKELKTHFEGEFGRIRTVRLGPDGMFYLTTSNRDGRWEAADGGDKIIRVNPSSLK